MRVWFGGPVLAIALALLPAPSLERGAPRTLAAASTIGTVAGLSPVVRAGFPIDFAAMSWTSGDEPEVRFLAAGTWTGWTHVHEDELPATGGRTFSSLIPARDAVAVQVRGANTGVRVIAINTTEGPRPVRFGRSRRAAEAAHLTQPAVVTRAQWGADESLRFTASGTEDWPQAFYATKKLIVHHTATANNDTDPAATVRAIYRYHAVDRGYGDIGYNFLVDAQGRISKGRYSGALGTRDLDTVTGEDSQGRGVTAAHTGGWNSGTMGIALLGTYTDAPVPTSARDALVDHLAWEAERHGIDPGASDSFVNPVSGETKTGAGNISGHRDWVATECPGGTLYADLPAIRSDVAAAVSGGQVADTTAPTAPANLKATGGPGKVTLGWTASTDAGGSGLAGYEIWRSNGGGSYTRIATTTGTGYTDAKLRKRTTYSYYVVAFDNAGNRTASSVVSATTR